MTDARPATTSAMRGVDALADSCRWLADAHLANDPQQVIAALCDVYRLLAGSGWVPPEKASSLLRLHAFNLDMALSQLVGPPSPTG